MDLALLLAIIATVCGVTGAVLGVINTWHQMRRDKVRIKVIPSHIFPVGMPELASLNFCLEVINLSEFPVVITDVGFLLIGGKHGTLATLPGMESSGSLPARLEPRSSYSKYFHVDHDTTAWGAVRSVYAKTQCGSEITGTSGALKQLIRDRGDI